MAEGLDRPCLVMAAPNGARRHKRDHPAVPLTLEEMLETAEACADAGAAAIHVHVRDRDGQHTLDPHLNARWYERLKERIGDRLVVQLTTEAAGRFGPAEQEAMVRAVRPEAISLAPREWTPELHEPDGALRRFLDWLAEAGIATQYILYSPEEMRRFHGWRRRGWIPQPRPMVLFVLGRYGDPREMADPTALCAFLADHDPLCPWMACAFGRSETAALLAAAALGGHLRVGFENNLQHGDGAAAADNADRVAAVADGLRLIGRQRASAVQARAILGTDGAAGG